MAKPLLEIEAEGPFVVVCMQECKRMNYLLTEIKSTLQDLEKGFAGLLNMSQKMEDLSEALGKNQVPGRNPFHTCNWEFFAWPSVKFLAPWWSNLVARCDFLTVWSSDLARPLVSWFSGLFNSIALITALMQVTARSESLPLDKMTIETHCTLMWEIDEAEHNPKDGQLVYGLFMEGARWPGKAEVEEPVDLDGTMTGGNIVEMKLKEVLPTMPLMYIKSIELQAHWEPQSIALGGKGSGAVAFFRHDIHSYESPTYTTTFRGPTYCMLATLNTIHGQAKWVLAGVALCQSDD
jgi:dynein heavy chain